MRAQVSSVALIGSFRQHYISIRESLIVFKGAGLEITTPKGADIIKPGIPFIRFESDHSRWTDEMIQVVALHRILRADFVFTVVPQGYVGRTTCYEIGRIIQAGKPIYFSDLPVDLPLYIPDSHISTAVRITEQIHNGTFHPQQLHNGKENKLEKLERCLINGTYENI